MTNELALKNLIDRYERLAFTNRYIFGYADRSNIYATYTDEKVLPFVCMIDKASRNGGLSLRFKPNKQQKELLKTEKTVWICTEEFFEELVNQSKYNKGEIFEMLIYEKNGQKWKKDHVPFTQDGDITINQVAYQIKFNKATFTTEQTLKNLERI